MKVTKVIADFEKQLFSVWYQKRKVLYFGRSSVPEIVWEFIENGGEYWLHDMVYLYVPEY